MEKTQQQIEQEMLELNQQFSEFLHTKGIRAKCKLAFSNMGEAAHAQHEQDVAQFEAVKAQSVEDNKEFVEFLHAKGVKAKFHLVVENVKSGAKTSPQSTAEQIARVQAQTAEAVARANAYGNSNAAAHKDYTAESLANEFNAFLRSKGLDGQYTVAITEEN